MLKSELASMLPTENKIRGQTCFKEIRGQTYFIISTKKIVIICTDVKTDTYSVRARLLSRDE